MSTDMNLERTEKTLERYDYVANMLFGKFKRAFGIEWQDNPEKFREWLVSIRPTFAADTWRHYRSAVAYIVEQTGAPELGKSIRSLAGTDCIREQSLKRTSASKTKKIRGDDLAMIIQLLNRNEGANDYPTSVWLVAGILTGLRPSEWHGARLVGNELDVPNAKNTNGRAGSERRYIRLEGNDEEMEIIREMVRLANSQDDFEMFYTACRRRLWRVCRRLWPNRKRHPTLYSSRHQFTANLKAANVTLESMAVLMGHAADDTASEHYGRRKFGEAKAVIATPSDRNTALVRKKFKQRQLTTNKEGIDVS